MGQRVEQTHYQRYIQIEAQIVEGQFESCHHWQHEVLLNIVLFNLSEKCVPLNCNLQLFNSLFGESFMIYLTLFCSRM